MLPVKPVDLLVADSLPVVGLFIVIKIKNSEHAEGAVPINNIFQRPRMRGVIHRPTQRRAHCCGV